MHQDTGHTPDQVSPTVPLIDTRSTEIPGTFTRADGTATEGVIRFVHAPGAPVPDRLRLTELPEEPDAAPLQPARRTP